LRSGCRERVDSVDAAAATAAARTLNADPWTGKLMGHLLPHVYAKGVYKATQIDQTKVNRTVSSFA